MPKYLSRLIVRDFNGTILRNDVWTSEETYNLPKINERLLDMGGIARDYPTFAPSNLSNQDKLRMMYVLLGSSIEPYTIHHKEYRLTIYPKGLSRGPSTATKPSGVKKVMARVKSTRA